MVGWFCLLVLLLPVHFLPDTLERTMFQGFINEDLRYLWPTHVSKVSKACPGIHEATRAFDVPKADFCSLVNQ